MIYGKLKNGILIECPTDLVLETGEVIVNVESKPDILKEHGYKEIERIIPSVSANQYVVLQGYSESIDKIIVNYTVEEKVIEPSAYEELAKRIEVLESNELGGNLNQIMNEEVNK